MWIQVRSMDGRKTVQLQNLSKLTRVEEVREKLEEHFGAPPEQQRLFYRGKQLEDGHTLFDYDVGLNDLVQLLVRAPPLEEEEEGEGEGEKEGEAVTGAEQMDTVSAPRGMSVAAAFFLCWEAGCSSPPGCTRPLLPSPSCPSLSPLPLE